VIQRDEKDPAFGQFVDEILVQYRGKTFSTFDLKRLAEKYAGKPLDWFFDDWVFGSGIPKYSMTSNVEAGANGFVISGNITQSEVPDTFEMPVPVYADDMFLGNVTVSSTGGEFRFTSRVRPQQVLIDPRKTVLMQDSF
jgi:aminopeptidase N